MPPPVLDKPHKILVRKYIKQCKIVWYENLRLKDKLFSRSRVLIFFTLSFLTSSSQTYSISCKTSAVVELYFEFVLKMHHINSKQNRLRNTERERERERKKERKRENRVR